MRRKSQLFFAVAFTVIIGLVVLTPTRSLAQSATDPPYFTATNLANRIARAERIIATNWLAGQSGQPTFSTPIPRNQVKSIVKAVSEARANLSGLSCNCIFDWELQFYQGTNSLGAFHFQGSVFVTDREFQDASGILEKLYKDLTTRAYAAEMYKDEDKDFAAVT